MTLIVLFNLKEGASAQDYEHWANSVDVPTVKHLNSVDEFKVFKMAGLLGSDLPSPYQYVEIIEVNDPDLLGQEIAAETMQRVAAEFQTFADQPIFMIASQIA
jgi:hypothetical protein